MRPLKTKQDLIAEGYQAEGALVFLDDFIEEEKKHQMELMLNCPVEELPMRRAVYKYINGLKKTLMTKIQTGIYYATEQVSEIESEELGKED